MTRETLDDPEQRVPRALPLRLVDAIARDRGFFFELRRDRYEANVKLGWPTAPLAILLQPVAFAPSNLDKIITLRDDMKLFDTYRSRDDGIATNISKQIVINYYPFVLYTMGKLPE